MFLGSVITLNVLVVLFSTATQLCMKRRGTDTAEPWSCSARRKPAFISWTRCVKFCSRIQTCAVFPGGDNCLTGGCLLCCFRTTWFAEVMRQNHALRNPLKSLHRSLVTGIQKVYFPHCKVVVSMWYFQAGFSALHLAAQNGHNQSARVLLYAGASPDHRNNVSFRTLSHCCSALFLDAMTPKRC